MRRNKFAMAFTLAEVLIVIGIIGLIADMTIPTIISNTQTTATVSQLQKTYSTLENAFRMAVQENGTPENWGFGNTPDDESNPTGGSGIIAEYMGKHMNIMQNCGNDKGCFAEGTYKWLNNNEFMDLYNTSSYAKIRLADGEVIGFTTRKSKCDRVVGYSKALQNECGLTVIDINGDKKPNVIGKDTFFFHMTKFGFVPTGAAVGGSDLGGAPTTYSYDFAKNCNGKGGTYPGRDCTAWVLYNKNMDYLHCNDLSWGGKTKCK